MTNPKMKPCPKCQIDAGLGVFKYESGWCCVECDYCYYHGPSEGSILQAIKSHNERVTASLSPTGGCMMELTGPVGFEHIESAPRDGTFVRLRFRPGFGRDDREEIGRWERHQHMAAGGAWFTSEGGYITPGALFWAPTLSSTDGSGAMAAPPSDTQEVTKLEAKP